MRDDITALIAERDTLIRMIDATPPASLIQLNSLNRRLRDLTSIIEAMVEQAMPARVDLTFKGQPVFSSRGILAEFAAKATDTFHEMVSALVASQRGPVSDAGPIPGKRDANLFITGTTTGSFGFRFEEVTQDGQMPLIEPTPGIHAAIENVHQIFKSSIGTDDELTEAVNGLDPRVIRSIVKFLATVAEWNASCSLSLRDKDKIFSFSSPEQVQRAAERLRLDNVHQLEVQKRGFFVGFIPTRRIFEFVVGNAPVIGRVPHSIGNADVINSYLMRPVSIKLLETRVGDGSPRYQLQELPEWDNVSDQPIA